MEQLFNIHNLAELEQFLKTAEKVPLRNKLKDEYLRLTEYSNADEWNRLVRICEVFSIIGWGNIERVDAHCYKVMNQWHTELRNKQKEKRFLQAGWTKRKNGFALFNPSYHSSPDRPNQPSINWEQYPKRPEVLCPVPELANQRNKQKVNPISFGGIYTLNTKIDRDSLFPLLRSLRKHLDLSLTPESYGEDINAIAIRYITAQPHETQKTHFEKGTYFPKKKEYSCDVFIGNEYVKLFAPKRKELIKQLLTEVLDDVKAKEKKYKLNYNTDLLIADTMRETDKWMAGNTAVVVKV